MYADDTVLFYPDSDVAVIQQKLNDDLELIGTWLLDNGLFVNTSKTESMLFGTHARLSRVDEFTIFMNGRLINSYTLESCSTNALRGNPIANISYPELGRDWAC